MKVVSMPARYAARITPQLMRADRNVISPYGQRQGEAMPGAHWRCDITWDHVLDDDQREIARWLTEISRADVYTTAEGKHRFNATSLDFQELLSNPDFISGITGWSATDATLAAGTRRLRIANTDAVNTAIAYQTIALAAGDAYLLLAHSMAGSHALFRADIYDLGAAADVVTMNSNVEGLLVVPIIATNTGDHQIRLRSRTATIGDHLFYSGASLARCALVDGADQVGNAVKIKGLPISTDGIIRAGEYVTFMTDAAAGTGIANPKLEMKELTADLDSDAAGGGWLYFEPMMRSQTMLDNAPVMIHRPRYYGYSPQSSLPMDITPPRTGSLSFTVEEDILAP